MHVWTLEHMRSSLHVQAHQHVARQGWHVKWETLMEVCDGGESRACKTVMLHLQMQSIVEEYSVEVAMKEQQAWQPSAQASGSA